MNFQPLTKQQIVNWIRSHDSFDGSQTEEELNSLTKPQLIALASNLESISSALESIELEEPSEELEEFDLDNVRFDDDNVQEDILSGENVVVHSPVESDKSQNISPSDPEWTNFILNLLVGNEYFEKEGKRFPTSGGLRRIFPLVTRCYYSTETQIVQVPTPENEGRASVIVTLTYTPAGASETLRVSGCSDIFHGNTKNPFCNFPVATAETIAESRAFKKALHLNCSTADEMNMINPKSDNFTYADRNNENSSFDLADESYLNLIKNTCAKHDIDPNKLVKFALGVEASLETLTKPDAAKAVRCLSEFHRDPSKIPDNLKV